MTPGGAKLRRIRNLVHHDNREDNGNWIDTTNACVRHPAQRRLGPSSCDSGTVKGDPEVRRAGNPGSEPAVRITA